MLLLKEELIKEVKYRNPWTVESIKKKTEEIMKKGGFESEIVHGTPHIERVVNYHDKLFYSDNSTKVSSHLKRLLKIAEYTHDIGRLCKGNHAENSAVAFEKALIPEISKDDFECILYAIRNHSAGLTNVARAESKKDKLLGLLCLVDHLDSLGSEGRFRTAIWSKESGKNIEFCADVNKIKFYKLIINKRACLGYYSMTQLRTLMDQFNNLKKEGFVEHFLYNLIATKQILKPIEHLLSSRQKMFVRERENLLWTEVSEMINYIDI